YPSQMEDSNGNFITLTYGPANGDPYYVTNDSSRILYISDARGNPGGYGNTTYGLTWTFGGLPHLATIISYVGTPENYSFSYTTQALQEPFTPAPYSSATTLQSMTVSGLN